VLAARAAEAIQTAKLHEGVRRAAQVRQLLLRELNHRVKNNLATIAALFSIDRPHMPREAQAWVNRLTERVATMARTHELFVGGTDRVDLRELVARLLPGLSVITPPGAQVKLDVPDLGVKLGTQRAVSLAMVLNELCWNALEHGTAENGTLHVRAASLEGRQLLLEVQDEGKGHNGDHSGDAENGRGVGLRLVRGLVSRELSGRLELTTSDAGGTTARIEIPLDQPEA
jgi:two-component sensor histidine kinase